MASTMEAARHEALLPSIHVAEINSCGALHTVLARLPNLAYSEYIPERSSVRHEDLLALTYPDASFDVVLHSDTLEHTPNVDQALAEIRRVLKPGGVSIFTVPIVRDGRKTVVRAELRDGSTHHILEPSYHGGSRQTTKQYLVYYEFGADFTARLSGAGFDVTLYEHPSNPAVVTFVAQKPVPTAHTPSRSA
jgi:SAM-dependent methyltransferase